MQHQISEEPIAKIYDGGYRALSLDHSGKNKLSSLDHIDFDKLLECKNPKKKIQALEPIDVYHSLMEKGVADCIDVLPHLSQEQVTRILDYDIWHEDTLVPKQAFEWLKHFGEIGTEEVYKRFSQLEEEYQLAILGPYIRLYDQEEFENLSDADQDRLTPLPSNEAYYEVLTSDDTIIDGIENLVQSVMAHNMAYALSMLAYASYLPPAEQEALIKQFREARIEEDGFISFEESQKAFFKIDISKMKSKFGTIETSQEGIFPTEKKTGLFIDQVLAYGEEHLWQTSNLDELNKAFLYLANNLCAASQISTDDLYGLKVVMKHSKSLISMGLEYLSDGSLELAAKILLQEYPKRLFQVGINLVFELRDSVIASLEFPDKNKVERYLRLGKFGNAQDYIDYHWLEKLGFELAETIKGLCNRYPVRPVSTDSEHHKVTFAPIASLNELKEFSEQLQNISGMIMAQDKNLLFVNEKDLK